MQFSIYTGHRRVQNSTSVIDNEHHIIKQFIPVLEARRKSIVQLEIDDSNDYTKYEKCHNLEDKLVLIAYETEIVIHTVQHIPQHDHGLG